MATLRKPSQTGSTNLHTDSEIQDRHRSIRLLRDAIEHEPNEEKRFLLAEQLEELEAEIEEVEFGGLRPTQH